MKYFTNIWIALVLALSGCSFNVTDTQVIDIENYPESEKNAKLAEDLMYYDPRYLAYKLPSFNESTSQGIKLGYFVRSSDAKASYRVTYSMKVLAVASNVDSLKTDFENYIPKLAETHVSKAELFDNLSIDGREWAISLFSSSAEDVLSASSSELRKSLNEEQLTTIINDLSTEYGSPSSTDFVRAQYYEEFGGFSESVTLNFLQEYKNGKKALVRVSLHEENGNWLVMGFGLVPQA